MYHQGRQHHRLSLSAKQHAFCPALCHMVLTFPCHGNSVYYRKASTMFKLHGKSVATAGIKRKHSDAELPGSSTKSVCLADATDVPTSGPKERACFELLQVNGIPAWANRYTHARQVLASTCLPTCCCGPAAHNKQLPSARKSSWMSLEACAPFAECDLHSSTLSPPPPISSQTHS